MVLKRRAKKGKTKGGGKGRKNSKEREPDVEESPPKEAEPEPLPPIKQQSGKLDPVRNTFSLRTVQKLLDTHHDINDYDTLSIPSEPRSGILDEEREQNKPHQNNDYAKHLERRNTEILRQKSQNKNFQLSDFRMHQIIENSSSKSGSAKGSITSKQSQSSNGSLASNDIDADAIVSNIVEQHPQLKGQQDQINTILSIVSDVIMQQMGPSAPGSIEEQVNERLAGHNLFKGLDGSLGSGSSAHQMPSKIQSTSFNNLNLPDHYSPKEGPSALNADLVNRLHEEFEGPDKSRKYQTLKSNLKKQAAPDPELPTLESMNSELMNDLQDEFEKSVRFPDVADDTQSILSEDLQTLKNLGIDLTPSEKKSEEQKEQEREEQTKKMHRLRAESKRATMLEEEILQFCRFLSTDLAQTEFQPLNADTFDPSKEMKDMESIINSDQVTNPIP
jgi:hypothetical protein